MPHSLAQLTKRKTSVYRKNQRCPIHCYPTTSQTLRISTGAGAGPLLNLQKELLFSPALSPANIKYKEKSLCVSALRIKVSFHAPTQQNKRSNRRTKLTCRSYRLGQCFFLEAAGWLSLHLHGACSGINWSSNGEAYKTGPPEIILNGATDGRRTMNRMCSVQGSIKADDLRIQGADSECY